MPIGKSLNFCKKTGLANRHSRPDTSYNFVRILIDFDTVVLYFSYFCKESISIVNPLFDLAPIPIPSPDFLRPAPNNFANPKRYLTISDAILRKSCDELIIRSLHHHPSKVSAGAMFQSCMLTCFMRWQPREPISHSRCES